MPDCTTAPKRIALICKSGPAFSPAEVARAHVELDLVGAPRNRNGQALTLDVRIAWLRGKMSAMQEALEGRP